MNDWLSKRPEKKSTMSSRDFSRFVESHKGGIKSGRSVNSWKTAWKAWRDLQGDSVNPGDPLLGLISRQAKGRLYNAGDPANTSPDVIDSGRLGKMSTELIKMGEDEFFLSEILPTRINQSSEKTVISAVTFNQCSKVSTTRFSSEIIPIVR